MSATHTMERRESDMTSADRLWPVLLLCSACVQTNAVVLNPGAPRLAPTCEDAVILYTEPSKVPGEFVELAILNSKGESSWTTEAGMYASMRRKAAEFGANGVLVAPIRNPGAGAEIAGALFGTGANRKGEAMAILVYSDSAAARARCQSR